MWREFADATLVVSIPDDRLHAHNGRLLPAAENRSACRPVRLVRYGLLLGEVRPGRSIRLMIWHWRLLADAANRSTARQPIHNWPPICLGPACRRPGRTAGVLMAVDGFGWAGGKRVGGH